LSLPVVRPAFDLPTQMSRSEARDAVAALVEPGSGSLPGKAVKDHVFITVPDNRRHFWSPWLHMDFVERDGQTLVHGRFMPHPNLTTGIMGCYFAAGTLGMFAACFVCAQLMLKNPPTALWVLGLCMLVVGGVWAAARIGQHLARDQMMDLHDTIRHAVSGAE